MTELPFLMNMTETGVFLGYDRRTIHDLTRLPHPKGLGFVPRGRKHKRISQDEARDWAKRNMVYNAASPEFKKAIDGRSRS